MRTAWKLPLRKSLAHQKLEAFDIRKSTLQLETAHCCHLRVS
jgi:hypothetical protein